MPPTRMLEDREKRELLDRINSGDGGKHPKPHIKASFTRADMDEENRTIRLSFSSETPIDWWWGTEVLEHTVKAVDLSRFAPGAFGPVLTGHDYRTPTSHIGVVEEAEVDERRKKVVGTMRFSKHNEIAKMIWNDIGDRIRGNVSIGYQVLDIVLEEEKKGDLPRYRVTKWMIYEVSVVSVPADIKVGVGRSVEQQPTATAIGRKEGAMPPEKDEPTVAAATATPATQPASPPAPQPDVRQGTTPQPSQDDRSALERERVTKIRAIGQLWKDRGGPELAEEFVRNGRSIDEYRAVLMERLAGQPNPPIRPATGPELGLSNQERESFSLIKLIRSVLFPNDHDAQEKSGFEREVCVAHQKAAKREPQGEGYTVPHELLRLPLVENRWLERMQPFLTAEQLRRLGASRRDMQAGVATAGGYLIGTELMGTSFIDSLRNSAVTMQLGTVLGGLVGNVAIPRKTGSTTGYWIAEGQAPTESNVAIGQLFFTPRHVGAYTELTRQLLMQNSIDAEMIVRADIFDTLGLKVDSAAIKGGGSGEPVGILSTSGIGDVALGTNGGPPTWAKIVECWTDVAGANALLDRLAWLTNAVAAGKLMTTQKVTGESACLWDPEKLLMGYPAFISNNVPSDGTKGTGTDLSAQIFGNWNDLVFAMWDGLDVLRDPYGTHGLAGNVRIRVLQSIDIGLRHAASFTAIQDMITT